MSARRPKQDTASAKKRIRPIPFRPAVVKPAQFLGLAPVFWLNVVLAVIAIIALIAISESVRFGLAEHNFDIKRHQNDWTTLKSQIDKRIDESKKTDVNVKKVIDEIILNEVPNACKKVAKSLAYVEPVYYEIVDSKRVANTYSRPYSGFFFMPTGKRENEGYILTTYNAVDGADYAIVTLPDEQITRAKVIGGDADSNIGVLKIDMSLIDNPSAISVVEICTEVGLGEPVITAGASHRWKSAFFRGAVSNLNRSLEFTLRNGQIAGTNSVFYQVSSPISRGIEGGPTANSKGEVVAVNMHWLSTEDLYRNFSFNYEYVKNLNFSLPIGYAMKVADDIVAQGHVSRAYLGFDLQTFDVEGKSGKVLVSYVAPDSPADKAGVKPGDVLLTVGPSPVEARDNDDLAVVRRRLSELKTGSNVELKLDRNGSSVTVKVTPQEWSEEGDFEFLCTMWEISLKPLTPREAARRGFKQGKGFFVSFVDRTGSAYDAGIRIGDVILAIENETPTTKAGIEQLYQKLAGDKSLKWVFFKVLRSGFTRCFLVSNSLRISSEGDDGGGEDDEEDEEDEGDE